MANGNGNLTDKQQAFIDEYFKCHFNATRAYIAAGYSPKNAGPNAGNLLNTTKIRAAIDERLKRETISADEALRLLVDHATGDLGDYIDDDGYLDIERARADGKTHLIREYRQNETYSDDGDLKYSRVSVKLYDAQSALKEIIKLYRLDSGDPTDRLSIQLKWPDKPSLSGDE